MLPHQRPTLHVCQRWPARRVRRSSSETPMAAMPFARIARQLATQGNIKVSNSGMNFSGHNSPAIPNAIPSWTTKHSPKLFTARDSNERIPFHWNVKEASRGSYQGFFAGWQTRGSKPPHCRLRILNQPSSCRKPRVIPVCRMSPLRLNQMDQRSNNRCSNSLRIRSDLSEHVPAPLL